MAYKSSYRDFINRYKKTIEKPEDPFTSHIFYIEPPLTDKFFNRSSMIYHRYTLEIPEAKEAHNDSFSEIPEWLRTINDIDCDADYMTGYYLAKYILPEKPVIYYCGCAKRNIIEGINAVNVSEWFGTDVNYDGVKGITGSSDLEDYNVIRSLKNNSKRFNVFLCDINPSTKIMYATIILAQMAPIAIIRMPEIDTDVINFLSLCAAKYGHVRIFKTPWGEKPRYYLFLSRPRNVNTGCVIKYLQYYENGLRFIRREFYDEINSEEFIEEVQKIKAINTSIPKEDANAIWLETVSDTEKKYNETS